MVDTLLPALLGARMLPTLLSRSVFSRSRSIESVSESLWSLSESADLLRPFFTRFHSIPTRTRLPSSPPTTIAPTVNSAFEFCVSLSEFTGPLTAARTRLSLGFTVGFALCVLKSAWGDLFQSLPKMPLSSLATA